jgi:hypothetical protein
VSVRHNIRHAVAFWDEHVGDDDSPTPRGTPTDDAYTMGEKPGFKKVAGCGCGWRVEGDSFEAIAEEVGFHIIAPSEDDGTAEGAQRAHDEARQRLYAQELTELEGL